MFEILKKIPQRLLEIKSTDLYQLIPDLTLMYFKGKKEPALFLSCLTHGNEYTGLEVIQKLLKKYGEQNWPRSVYLMFGNVTAARQGRRHLDDQPDYNRIWKAGDHPAQQRALQILNTIKDIPLFASVDLHNNTGRNPRYSVVTSLDLKYLNLAALFSDQSLYICDKLGTVTENMSEICPSVTLEAGIAGQPGGTAHVLGFVEDILTLDDIPDRPVTELKLTVLETLGTIKIKKESSVGLGTEQADIVFAKDFDLLNFTEVPAGSVFGRYEDETRLDFTNQQNEDIGDDYFAYQNGVIMTKKAMIPAMITLDKRILKSDCVCYAMARLIL